MKEPKRITLPRSIPLQVVVALLVCLLGVIVLFILPGSKVAVSGGTGISVVPADVNYPAPRLTLQNLNGNFDNLENYRGMVILVNNWATWCPPCKAEMPDLQEYYSKHSGDGFVLIAINSGDPENKVTQFVSDYGLTFPVWLDTSNEALQVINNPNLPNSIVIDRGGIVRLTWTGQVNLETLEQTITPLLEE